MIVMLLLIYAGEFIAEQPHCSSHRWCLENEGTRVKTNPLFCLFTFSPYLLPHFFTYYMENRSLNVKKLLRVDALWNRMMGLCVFFYVMGWYVFMRGTKNTARIGAVCRTDKCLRTGIISFLRRKLTSFADPYQLQKLYDSNSKTSYPCM